MRILAVVVFLLPLTLRSAGASEERLPTQKAGAGAVVRIGGQIYRVEVLPRPHVVLCTDPRYLCVLPQKGAGHVFDRYRPSLASPVRLPAQTSGVDVAAGIAVVGTAKGRSCEVLDLRTGKRRAGPFPVRPAGGFTLGGKGRYLYPHSVGDKAYHYLDLEQNKVVEPRLNAKPYHYAWSRGVGLGDGRFCVFSVRVKKDKILSAHPDDIECRRAVWSVDAPGTLDVTAFRWPVGNIFARHGRRLVVQLAHLKWGFVDTKTWKVLEAWRPEPGLGGWDGHAGPRGGWWTVDSHRGVQLRKEPGGKVLWESRHGAPGNAHSLGVTFVPADRGLVAAPYRERLAIVKIGAEPTVVGLLQLDVPASGAFALPPAEKGKPGRLLVLQTRLPYE